MRKAKLVRSKVLASILVAAMTVSTFGASAAPVFADDVVAMEEEAADEQEFYEEVDEEAPDETFEEPDAAEEAEEDGMDDFDVEIPDTCEEGEDVEFPEECEEGVDGDAEEAPEEMDEDGEEDLDFEDEDLDDPENVTAEDPEQDEAVQIKEVIDQTIEMNQDKGIYVTLNQIFFALCNEGFKVDKNNLDEIEDMIFNSLLGIFDVTDRELDGAIGAAIERAKMDGLIVAANGSSKSAQEDWNEAAKKIKPAYDNSINSIIEACPKFKTYAKAFQALGDFIFKTTPVDRTDEVLEELRQVEAQIDTATNELKDHTYNVVALADIGDKFGSVKNKAATIRTIIQNTLDNPNLNDDEKLNEIANLYKDSEFRSLMSAMNGAADCFFSTKNDIFETNIFDAAFNRACEEVMFSGEAIDTAMPYIIRQFSYYIAAYATMNEVFDAYEHVYGEGSLTQSRLDEAQNTAGTDLEGNKICDSVSDLIANFLSRDRYVFVGQSDRTKIPVSRELYIAQGDRFVNACIDDPYGYRKWSKTPDCMTKSPLSTTQLEDLAKYCEQKNITLFDFLLNVMDFKFYTSWEETFWMDFEMGGPNNPVWYHSGVYWVPSGSSVKGTVYLATGKSIDKDRSGDSCRLDYAAVNATKVTSKVEKVQLAGGALNANLGIRSYTYYYNTPIFFMAR